MCVLIVYSHLLTFSFQYWRKWAIVVTHNWTCPQKQRSWTWEKSDTNGYFVILSSKRHVTKGCCMKMMAFVFITGRLCMPMNLKSQHLWKGKGSCRYPRTICWIFSTSVYNVSWEFHTSQKTNIPLEKVKFWKFLTAVWSKWGVYEQKHKWS